MRIIGWQKAPRQNKSVVCVALLHRSLIFGVPHRFGLGTVGATLKYWELLDFPVDAF
jgi:hypothetical protein